MLSVAEVVQFMKDIAVIVLTFSELCMDIICTFPLFQEARRCHNKERET